MINCPFLIKFYYKLLMKQPLKFFLAVFTIILINGCADTNLRTPLNNEGVLLLGATTHLGNGDVISNSAIGIKDGYVTLLADAAVDKLELSRFEVDKLGPEFHIYAFKKAQLGNSGIILVRKDKEHINITIRDKELEKSIVVGNEAMLLICKGSIEDFNKFKVDFVYMGQEKVYILNQSDFKITGEQQ